MKVRTKKRDSGNVLVIVTLSICMIVVPLSLVLIQIGMYLIDRDRAESTVEAACLVAANDLSRIVIDDPHFGYVSLSNYPPVGRGLRAPDGEPLPVVGINTLVGTVRQNTIIAHELGNETIGALVDDDREALDKTIKDLNFAWRCALSNRGRYRDIHGEEVILLDDVTDFIESHLPPNLHVRSIDLSQGWLVDEGGTTTISVPEPAMYARVNASDQRGGKYKPFRNIPLFNRPFSFAGAGASSSLVPLNQFQDADARHICSIVKIDCTIERDGPCRNFISASSDAFGILHCKACAQPYTMPDTGPRGILTLRFTGEPVPGLQSWSDLLKDNFHDNRVTTYEVVGGDYPLDGQARMKQFEPPAPPSTGRQFSEHFYYWLRNGHLRPHVDAVLRMVNDSFKARPLEIYTYEFASDGDISRRVIARDPFPIGVTADSQLSTVCDTSVQGGVSPIIIIRDNVSRLGTKHGGKHCGEPLEGHPLNWCELTEYGGDEHMAKGLGKGRLGTRLTLLDPDCRSKDASDDPNFFIFRRLDGSNLSLQPRRSFYSGGLAVDIEIGGISGSTAAQDVQSMRRLNR